MKRIILLFIFIAIIAVLPGCNGSKNICDVFGHYYEETIINPTCENDGYKMFKCKDCSHSYKGENITALGHNIIEVEEVIPTCTEDGHSAGTKCSRCTDKNEYTIYPALDHELAILDKIDPTCTTTGLTEGSYCLRCEYQIKQEVIEKLDHDIITDERVEPTCTNTGLTEGSHCSRCDYKVLQEVIEKLDHDYLEKITHPTCTNQGYTTHTCITCEDEYVDSYTEKLDHDIIIDERVEPTCTMSGLTEGSHCSRCDYSIKQEQIPSLGHEEVITIKGLIPTNEKSGLSDQIECSVCNEIVQEQIFLPAKGYDWIIEDNEIKILFVGNSYSEDATSCAQGSIDSPLLSIIKSMVGENIKVTIGVIISGGKGMNWHATKAQNDTSAYYFKTINSETKVWSSSKSMTMKNAFTYTNWDMISLQPYSVNTSTGIESNAYPNETDSKFLHIKDSSAYLLDYVHQYAPQAEVYLYMHWAQTSAIQMNAALSKYNSMANFFPSILEYQGEKTGKRFTTLVPVGLSIQNARTTYLSLLAYNTTAYADKNLNYTTDAQIGLQRDGGHVSFNVGRYIASLTFAEQIIPESLRVLEYILPDIRYTESIGQLPKEYTEIAQLSVFAAIESWKNGDLGVTNIDGYAIDPIKLAKTNLEQLTLYLDNCTEEEFVKKLNYLIINELSSEYVIDRIEINHADGLVSFKLRFGYMSETITLSYDVNKNGHNLIIDEKVEPTCTTTGLTEGSHCSRCNYEIAQEVIPALGHEYSDWVIVINPSCNSEGKDEKTCIKCGNIIERDTRITGIENKVLVSNPVDPEYFVGKTLLTIGDSITFGVGLNDKTNEYYGKLVADALGMNVINKGISGSVYCYGGSATTNNTLNASNIKNADVITIFLGINDFNHACKNGHAYGNPNYTISDRTYYQVGEYGTTDISTLYGALKVWCENIEQLKSIEGYEDKQFVIITPLISSWNASIGPRSWDQGKTNIHGHTLREYCTAIMRVYAEYGIPVFDANMLSGIYYNSSSDNNAVATGGDGVHINAEGHKILANSLIEFLLEGYSYEYRENNSNAHQYNKTIVDPTCTLDGYTKHICSICYDVYNTDFVNALGHEIIINEKVEPTCESTGLTKGEYCIRCDYKIDQEVIPVLGHNVVIDEEVEPTCVNTGLTEGSHCSTCNKVFEEQISIPIVEHNYVNGVCISCNKEKMPYQRLTYFNVYVEINDKQYKDNAVLYLPANYTPTGEPSKLIIFCKQGISKITSNSNPIEQVGFYNYLLTLGYAILGVDGVPDEWKNEIGICERVVGNPYAAKATETAYHYVIDNYNLDDKGCFISGYSQGGHYAQNVIDLTDIPILAAAEQSPVCSMRYHQWDLTENVTINGVKFTKGARINLARIYGFSEVKTNSELLNLKYDENLLSEYDPWIRNTTNVYNGFVQKSNLWYLPTNFDLNSLTMTKEVKCPVKIWCSEDDGEISADVMKVFVKAIQNAGGHAEISIAQKGGHGYFKNQTPVGYFYENGKKYNTLPIAVETAEWFAKFGGYTCKHSYSETIVEPTCVEQGYTNYTCITCGHTYKDNYVDSIDHSFIEDKCINCEIER